MRSVVESTAGGLGSGDRGAHTRARLSRAYLEMLADGGALSAGQVADRAGVNRSSFYAHFTSLDDLAVHALREAVAPGHRDNLARLESARSAALESNRLVIHDIVRAATAPAGALARLMADDRHFAEWAFGTILNDYVADYLRIVPAFASLAPARAALARRYIGHALAAVICGWIAGELALTTVDLEVMIAGLLPPWILEPDRIEARIEASS